MGTAGVARGHGGAAGVQVDGGVVGTSGGGQRDTWRHGWVGGWVEGWVEGRRGVSQGLVQKLCPSVPRDGVF